MDPVGRPEDAILGARFSEIPEGVAIVGNVASGKELREALGMVPPSDVIIERGSFTLVYRFPRSSSRRLEEAMRDLATIVAEGASNSGLEVHEENGSDELLILRVKRVLHPSELDLPIVDVLRNYTQRLEEYVSGVLDGV
ncbi:hypothetical protein [Conexivisphaera calida]|uniref:hypothetical protein n=1 Tax=Conexivisphaera calida TaxID=1874277 RepID=UPI00157AFFAC|nr:hypothetical protein [Conexivisphaera calida]